jgi:hypothetical protein
MSELWRVPVASSMVSEVAYTDSGDMVVTFANGKEGMYSDVPEEVALRLSKAPSVGEMMHSEIIPTYSYRKL